MNKGLRLFRLAHYFSNFNAPYHLVDEINIITIIAMLNIESPPFVYLKLGTILKQIVEINFKPKKAT